MKIHDGLFPFMDADPTNVNYLNTFLQVHTNSGQVKNDEYFQANLGTVLIRDEQSGSYFRQLRNIFWVKIFKFFDSDPGSGLENVDPGS